MIFCFTVCFMWLLMILKLLLVLLENYFLPLSAQDSLKKEAEIEVLNRTEKFPPLREL